MLIYSWGEHYFSLLRLNDEVYIIFWNFVFIHVKKSYFKEKSKYEKRFLIIETSVLVTTLLRTKLGVKS
jgi:hypothetical protein